MLKRTGLLTALLLIASSSLADTVQEDTWIAMKDRGVTVTLSDGRSIGGRLVGVAPGTVTIQRPDGELETVSRDQVTKLRGESFEEKSASTSNQEQLLQSVCSLHGRVGANNVAPDVGGNSAKATVRRIAKAIGLLQPPRVFQGDVPNAMAALYGGERVILYNSKFIDEIKRRASSSWAATSILAHELGHHLNGHTVGRGATSTQESWMRELEADYYSGFALKKLGANLDDAESAMRAMNDLFGGAGSPTHPPIQKRLSKIREGWKAAKGPSRSNDEEDEEDEDENDVDPSPVDTRVRPASACCSIGGMPMCQMVVAMPVGQPCYCMSMAGQMGGVSCR